MSTTNHDTGARENALAKLRVLASGERGSAEVHFVPSEARALLAAMGASSREVLVHLNVTVPAGDDRDAGEIGDAILSALEVGSDAETMHGLEIAVPLAEEV